MRNLLLVRYGEIFLKGQNRPLFMRALVKRIKYAVKDLGATVLLHDGRILVSDFDDLDECIRRVTKRVRRAQRLPGGRNAQRRLSTPSAIRRLP